MPADGNITEGARVFVCQLLGPSDRSADRFSGDQIPESLLTRVVWVAYAAGPFGCR
jgi:hypothetical protein